MEGSGNRSNYNSLPTDDGKQRSGIAPRRSRKAENIDEGRRRSGSEDDSGWSSPASMEMDDIDSDSGDEGAALTTKERRQTLQRRFHSHNASEVPLSLQEKRKADKVVFRRLVVNGILIACWYTFATSISVYNKWMFAPDRLDFHFPLFTTSLHMLVQFGLASLVLCIFPKMRPKHGVTHDQPSSQEIRSEPSKPILTPMFYITRLVPCGIATALDIGLGNTSLKFISLTFLTMCKSSALAFVLLFAILFRLEVPSWKLILIIATMTIGVVMMVAGETQFNAKGFALIISSAFFSGFRWALTQILLLHHPATANPFSTQFFIAPIEFVALFCLALAAEGPREVIRGIILLAIKQGLAKGICLLIFPGCLAFCMISAEFALLQRTSVVTLSICGIFKEVVTIAVAELVYHDPLTPINISGLLVTIASIAGYNYLKITKMRQEAREKVLVGDEDKNVEGLETIDEERQGLVAESSRRPDSPGGSNRSVSPPKRVRDRE